MGGNQRQLFPLVSLKRPWRWGWKDEKWRDGNNREAAAWWMKCSGLLQSAVPPPLSLPAWKVSIVPWCSVNDFALGLFLYKGLTTQKASDTNKQQKYKAKSAYLYYSLAFLKCNYHFPVVVNAYQVCLLFKMSRISLSISPSHRRASVVKNVTGFESGLLCLKSGSIWRVVNMAALRLWVNEGGGFLLSQG